MSNAANAEIYDDELNVVDANSVEKTPNNMDEIDETTGQTPLFSKTSGENLPHKEDRIMKRAKRPSKEGAAGANNGAHVHISSHPRRSRHRHGNKGKPGQPKKGGAGGKGVWGKLGSEIDETGDCRDVNDPNYDSDTQGDYKLVAIEPILNDEELEKAVKPILQEYLEHGNTIEVEESLYDLNIGGTNGHKIVKMAIQLGLDRHNNQRELISQLISDLYNNVLSGVDISSGFDDLLNSIDDLRLDTPDAPNLLGQFIARCIADDCLAPKFITNYKGKVENKYFKEALDKANVLITMKQGMAHLDNIWGVGGGNRPVKYLTNKMVALLKEYLSSEDKQEAMRCIIELEVPHFHHEVVYQACDIAIENSTEPVINQMVSLIKFLTVDTVVITLDQFEKGIKRICDDIHDISLDVPNAAMLLDQMCVKLRQVRVIGDVLFQELSSKGRKRFVSEGDGGLMKPL